MTTAQNLKVQPETIRLYGKKAQAHFDSIRQDLQIMVNSTDRAPYVGDNAAAFKNTSNDMVATLSEEFVADMRAIADQVRVATSKLSQALGGQPIAIRVDGRRINPQTIAVAGGGTQSIDTVAVAGLPSILGTRFDSIRAALSAHLRDFQATGWQGQGKKTALGQVDAFTRRATRRCDDAQRIIVEYIKHQIETVAAADGGLPFPNAHGPLRLPIVAYGADGSTTRPDGFVNAHGPAEFPISAPQPRTGN